MEKDIKDLETKLIEKQDAYDRLMESYKYVNKRLETARDKLRIIRALVMAMTEGVE